MKLIEQYIFWKRIAFVPLFLFILFLLYDGCRVHNKRVIERLTLKAALDSITLQHERDSMSAAQHQKDYEDSLQFANGQISLQEAKLEATEAKLLSTTTDAALWKQKYLSVKPDTNSSVTLVDNDFIEDCHDCFNKVEEKDQLIRLYVRDNKVLDSAYLAKEHIQVGRIKQLGEERDAVRLTLNDCLAAAKRQQKTLQPRRKLLLSLSAIAIDRYYPSGVGAGLIYQDKYNRQFGLKGFGTNIGPIYTAELNLPLSFKRK